MSIYLEIGFDVAENELSEGIFLYLLIPRLRNTNIIDKGQYLQAR